MKIVGVIRVFNEDDIIEAVLRHHLAEMDHVIVLDDGSNDRTHFIIKNLVDEGFPIRFVERSCVVSNQSNRNSFLFNTARDELGADWVVFFDADEFLDMREIGTSLRDYLGTIPSMVDGIYVRLVNYIDSVTDDIREPLVPKRMVWRYIEPHDVYKVMLRAVPGVVVSNGNHDAHRDGKSLVWSKEQRIVFGHYYRRSAWQVLQKTVMGRLKPIAAGVRETKKGTGSHYIQTFETLMNNPEKLLQSRAFFEPIPDVAVMRNNPLAYRGGALRFTEIPDYELKFFSTVLHYLAELATEFGRTLDSEKEIYDGIVGALGRETAKGKSN